MTEKHLIKRCKEGDQTAFKKLYELYAGKMLGVCSRYVTDRDTARDLLHDGFVTVFTRIGDYREEGSFEGWLRRIFINTALMHLRKEKNTDHSYSADKMYDLQEKEASVLEQMSAQNLLDIIAELPPGYRTVLNLYAIEGFSHKEVADMLGISENTSRSQFARARTQLLKILQQRGLYD